MCQCKTKFSSIQGLCALFSGNADSNILTILKALPHLLDIFFSAVSRSRRILPHGSSLCTPYPPPVWTCHIFLKAPTFYPSTKVTCLHGSPILPGLRLQSTKRRVCVESYLSSFPYPHYLHSGIKGTCSFKKTQQLECSQEAFCNM